MPPRDLRALQRARQDRRQQLRRRRIATAGVLVAVVVVAGAAIAIASGGSSKTPKSRVEAVRTRAGHHSGAAAHRAAHHGSTVTGVGTGKPGTTPVPVLMYHVINPPPAGAPFPGLYVPAAEFAAQMQALKAAGWVGVTLDQLKAYWTRGVPLPPGKPVVLTFDNGYESQYTNALPVLRRLGWVADENIQLTGLPTSQGGLSDAQVKGLINAGWELDTQGMSHADLITLDAAQLQYQIDTARQTLRQRYGVPVNWFCYPSGHYNATVIAAVKAAGFIGSTTVIPGWASPASDLFELPRLRVLGGTSPQALLAQISGAQSDGPPPSSYGGAGED
jgi:peptidoglycan/xylan/chitin deacetylase (PgdA/CDA1 family)